MEIILTLLFILTFIFIALRPQSQAKNIFLVIAISLCPFMLFFLLKNLFSFSDGLFYGTLSLIAIPFILIPGMVAIYKNKKSSIKF